MAQTPENFQISVGGQYVDQTYYDLESCTAVSVAGDSWDIAFSVIGTQDAGIFINEAAPLNGAALELYHMDGMPFETTFTEADLVNRLYNDEVSWTNGAFNSMKDPMSPFDYGWGAYNPGSNSVNGTEVFVIKMRDSSFIKLQILNLNGFDYNFKYADLDGSNEQSATLNKMDFQGSTLAYFSFADNTAKNLEPAEWDLLFTRYSALTPNPEDPSEIIEYPITGILTRDGVAVAQLDGVDPETVVSDGTESADRIDIIGADWKFFSLTSYQWAVENERAYIVNTVGDTKYRLFFFDFEGSSTGTATFQKTLLETSSNDNLLEELFENNVSTIYPNPNIGNINIDINNVSNFKNARIEVYNIIGKRVVNYTQKLTGGNQTITLDTDLADGNYIVTLDLDGKRFSQKLLIRK